MGRIPPDGWPELKAKDVRLGFPTSGSMDGHF